MIDQRLREQSTYDVNMDQHIAAAVDQIRSSAMEAIRPTIAAFLVTYLEALETDSDQLPREHALDPVGVSQAELDVFATAMGEPLTIHLNKILQGDDETTDSPVAWIVGEALLDALFSRAKPTTDVLAVASLAGKNDLTVFGFVQAASELDDTGLDWLVVAFSHVVDHEHAHAAGSLMSHDGAQLAAARESWAAEVDFGEAWGWRGWDGMHMYSERLSIFGELCARLPGKFLALSERLKDLPLVDGVLSRPSITMDPDCLVTLIAAAPPIVDGSTGTWNRNVVAPIVVRRAFDYVFSLSGQGPHRIQPPAPTEEIGKWVEAFVQTIAWRPDGRVLLVRWMTQMLWYAESQAEDKPFQTVFEACIDALVQMDFTLEGLFDLPTADRGTDFAETQQLESDEANMALRRLLLATMIATERADNSMEVPELPQLRSAFLSLLRRAREAFSLPMVRNPPEWRHYAFAKLYLREDDVSAAWLEDFGAFAGGRRASVHREYVEGSSHGAPSVFLAGVGAAAIDFCVDPESNSLRQGQALAIWDLVFYQALPYATHWSFDTDRWRAILYRLFLRYPACYSATADESVGAEHARGWLAALGGDEPLFCIALACLADNGMPPKEIAIDVSELSQWMARGRKYLSWDALAGRQQVPSGVVGYWARHFKK